jgi:uncharacterized membrane protein
MHSVQRRASLALAAAFATSGGVHLVRPQSFASIMPRVIPREHHTKLIYASGAAELICAAGLLLRTWWAAPASVALLVAVFPANVQMALDSGSGQGPADNRAVAWGRLPLQAAMIWAAFGARPEADSPRS